jgi:hypothetical protein
MSKKLVINDDAWAKKLETEYEEYMWNCESMVDGEEPDNFATLSGEPFDGCSTCYTREQLFFLVPRIIEAAQNGQVALEE